ncbi:hypothetical protein Nmel_009648, partial [Mimus melanotis]
DTPRRREGCPPLTLLREEGGSLSDVRAGGKDVPGGRARASGVRPREQQARERSLLPVTGRPGCRARSCRGEARWAVAVPALSARPVRPVSARPVWSRPQPGRAARSRCLWETWGTAMSQPTAPPLYDDKNPLYPPPPGGYPQPPHYAGGYPQPGGYPAGPGYAQPGGYPHPGMAMPTMPVRFGDNGFGDDSPFQSVDWDDRKVRHAFIRKVYAIISLQLLVTRAPPYLCPEKEGTLSSLRGCSEGTVGAVFSHSHLSLLSHSKPVRSFVQANVAIYYASYAVFLVTYLVLACCQGPRRRFPWNVILLSIFVSRLGLARGPGDAPMAPQLTRARGDRKTRGQVGSPLSPPLSPTDAGHGADDRHDCQVCPGDPVVVESGDPSFPPQCSQLNWEAARSQGMLQSLGLKDLGVPVLSRGCGRGCPTPLWQEDTEVMYNTKAVLIAMLITAIVAIVVTIFCFQTKARRGMHPALPSVGSWSVGTPWALLAILRASHRAHGDQHHHCHRPLLQICEWGGQRGCEVPLVFLVGLVQAGGLGSPFAGKQGVVPALEGSLPAGRDCVGIGSSCSGCRQDLPCLTCCLPASWLTLLVPWLHMLYAAIGAIAFTLFLAYDTQLVLGNRKNTLSPEEYVYGALTIYTDIIYIFTFLLQILHNHFMVWTGRAGATARPPPPASSGSCPSCVWGCTPPPRGVPGCQAPDRPVVLLAGGSSAQRAECPAGPATPRPWQDTLKVLLPSAVLRGEKL